MIARDLPSNQTRGIMATRRNDNLMIRRECVIRMSWDPSNNKDSQEGEEEKMNEEIEEEKESRKFDAVRYFPCVIIDHTRSTFDTLPSQELKEEGKEEKDNNVEDKSILDQEGQLKEMPDQNHVQHQVIWEGLLCSHDMSSFVIDQSCFSDEKNVEDVSIFGMSKSQSLISYAYFVA